MRHFSVTVKNTGFSERIGGSLAKLSARRVVFDGAKSEQMWKARLK